jgi:pullulanase/glycogen debranching enzyme
LRGTPVADRFLGSPEIYGHTEREAEQSVNFVTCHDGFALNDLVSHGQKHNEENGENNNDSANDNRSRVNLGLYLDSTHQQGLSYIRKKPADLKNRERKLQMET